MSLPIEATSWEWKNPQQNTEPPGAVAFCSAERAVFKNLCPFCVLEREKLLWEDRDRWLAHVLHSPLHGCLQGLHNHLWVVEHVVFTEVQQPAVILVGIPDREHAVGGKATGQIELSSLHLWATALDTWREREVAAVTWCLPQSVTSCPQQPKKGLNSFYRRKFVGLKGRIMQVMYPHS